jgi:TP901 family phage tail tape measure protein
MTGFFQGTEGLDSVLMKLAEKWDTLDFTTQRYIATMAAGSRQQSRFIAMMSDYGRTTELVGAAQNSAGASQKQFDKTMESLEAKLNKLAAAWQEFTMGIANNELIKGAVDLLTKILEKVNGLVNGLPGLTKSFASLALVFVALRAGGALLNKALAGISGVMAKGVIDAGTAAGVIKQAETTGKMAGAAAAKGTA